MVVIMKILENDDWRIEKAANNNYYVTPLSAGKDCGERRKRIKKTDIDKFK